MIFMSSSYTASETLSYLTEKKNGYFKLHIIMTFTLPFTGGCATAENQQSEDESDLDYNGSDCISVRSIRDYKPLDDRTLLIYSGSRPYFVRLSSSSREMRSTSRMQVDSRDDRLCPYGGDGLIFGSFDPYPIRVRSISRITKEQENQLLVRYGKDKSGEPQAPTPQDVEGAEVEELD